MQSVSFLPRTVAQPQEELLSVGHQEKEQGLGLHEKQHKPPVFLPPAVSCSAPDRTSAHLKRALQSLEVQIHGSSPFSFILSFGHLLRSWFLPPLPSSSFQVFLSLVGPASFGVPT